MTELSTPQLASNLWADQIQIKLGPVRWALSKRVLIINLALCLGIGVMVVLACYLGKFPITINQTAQAIWGNGDKRHITLIQEFRLPRILTAIVVGFGMGLSGTMIQTLVRNRLATPDILGINEGATVAIIVAVTATTNNLMGLWWIAPLGAAMAAGLLIILSGGRVGTQGYRLLVIGIAVSSLLRSGSEIVISRLYLQHASSIYTWSLGSVANGSYDQLVPIILCIGCAVPVCLLCSRWLSLLRFEEQISIPLGLPLQKSRMLIVICVVVIAGLTVGAAGPIAFVALAAPIVASRLIGPSHVALLTAAWTGSLLVLTADTLGRIIASPSEIPVGVVCSVLGGPFLIWVVLNNKSNKRGS